MQFKPDRTDLGCCPTCGRNFRDVFDHPRIRVLKFEELPYPEAIDRYSREARTRQSADSRKNQSNDRLFDDGINVTPEIAETCSTGAVQRYFKSLQALEGHVVDPRHLLPPWQPHSYFRKAHPVPETRFFFAVRESDEATLDHRIADIKIECEGMNFGSGGGPTLQILGPVARIHYDGLLVESEDSVSVAR